MWLPSETKLKTDFLFFQEFLDAISLSAPLAITKIPEPSKLDSRKAKGNHLAGISAK